MQSNANNSDSITIPDTCDRLPRNTQVVVILDEFGITQIPNCYLKDCRQLKCIQMPGDIHTIGDYAFYNCTNLKSIVLPKRLYSTGVHCFLECSKFEVYQVTKHCTSCSKGSIYRLLKP